MNEYYSVVRSPDYLEHFGILGMKWGIRRYQNPDGSLTEEGKRRYGDILTPDQMKNYIRSYNLRTGKNKKINKKTVFKTSNGLYDYKGKKIDQDTEVDDPGKKDKKTDSKSKKISEMTTEELKTATDRMSAELDYLDKYNKLHPKKVSVAEKIINNFKDQLISEIPKAIVKNVANSISSDSKDQKEKKPGTQHTDNKTSDKKPSSQSTNSSNNGPKVSDIISDGVKMVKEAKEQADANNNSKVPVRRSSDSTTSAIRSIVPEYDPDEYISNFDDDFIKRYKERYKPLL